MEVLPLMFHYLETEYQDKDIMVAQQELIYIVLVEAVVLEQ